MRRILSLICTVALLAFASLGLAQSVATDPVGFITLNVVSPASTGGTATSLIGLSLTQPVSYQATLSSASGTTLTDSNATSAIDPFNGSNGAYYIELTTGTGAGRMSQITNTSSANKTITTADDLSSFVTAGTGYKIRPNWTLASVFGSSPATNLVLNGGTISTADDVLVFSTATQAYTTYYFKTSGVGGTGWRSTGSTSVDTSATPFKPTDGIIVQRHTAGALPNTGGLQGFALAGAVKLGQTQIPVAHGTNLLSNVYPSGTLTLGNSNLVTSGLTGGTISSADDVLIYDPVAAAYTTYYYKTSGVGGTGWRSTASTSADASGTNIPFGASIIIQRNNPGSFVWTVPQPFTITN